MFIYTHFSFLSLADTEQRVTFNATQVHCYLQRLTFFFLLYYCKYSGAHCALHIGEAG